MCMIMSLRSICTVYAPCVRLQSQTAVGCHQCASRHRLSRIVTHAHTGNVWLQGLQHRRVSWSGCCSGGHGAGVVHALGSVVPGLSLQPQPHHPDAGMRKMNATKRPAYPPNRSSGRTTSSWASGACKRLHCLTCFCSPALVTCTTRKRRASCTQLTTGGSWAGCAKSAGS